MEDQIEKLFKADDDVIAFQETREEIYGVKHLGFSYILTSKNDGLHNVYVYGTDSKGKAQAEFLNEHPEMLVKFLNTIGFNITRKQLRKSTGNMENQEDQVEASSEKNLNTNVLKQNIQLKEKYVKNMLVSKTLMIILTSIDVLLNLLTIVELFLCNSNLKWPVLLNTVSLAIVCFYFGFTISFYRQAKNIKKEIKYEKNILSEQEAQKKQ